MTMSTHKVMISIALFIVVATGAAIIYVGNLESALLRLPKQGQISTIFIINNDSDPINRDQFISSLRSMSVNPIEARVTGDAYFSMATTSDHTFVRMNKLESKEYGQAEIEEAIENIIKTKDMNGYVEYAFLNHRGDLISTRLFNPNLLP